MAVWSKVPPLTARCLSPLPVFETRPGHVRKLPVTWGWAVVFAGYSGFLHYLGKKSVLKNIGRVGRDFFI